MSIRCTLFGHSYAETEVEREREERGDEAVVTIREIQICDRCGNESVVSENKEVTSVAGPATDVQPPSDPEPTPAGPDPDVADDPESPARDPETDDAVILDDGSEDEPESEPEPEGRQYGEWPDADEGHASAESDPVAADDSDEPTPWPDAEGDDQGFDASAPTGEEPDVEAPDLADAELDDQGAADAGTDPAAGEDAELLDTGDDAGASGSDPQSSPSAGADDASGQPGSGIDRESTTPSPAQPGNAGTALYCPSCGYRDDSSDGSLRQGDICPECKKGYLAARD